MTYPDTLLIGHRVGTLSKDRVKFEVCAFSIKDKTAVTLGFADCVSYNYDTLKRADMPKELLEAFEKRLRTPS